MRSEEAKNITTAKPRSLFAVIASILSVGMVTAIAALFLFAWLGEEVLEGDTLAFDNAVREFIHSFANSWLTMLMQAVTFCGSTIFLVVVAVVVIALFLRNGHRHSAALFTVTMAGAVILNFVLKISFVRERPLPYFDTALPTSYSFPSGHALYALCFYGSLAWIYSAHKGDRVFHFIVWIFATILIVCIGFSRVYLGVHYPSDVLAGYAAAFVWLASVTGADAWLEHGKEKK
ncbi:MAG: phosphatase PAP2 family protein [Pyrinomonadaceae bacterium]